MKKTLLFLSMFLLSAGLFSQTIVTTWEFGPTSLAPSITTNGSPTDNEIVSHINVTNGGTEDVTIKVARNQISMMPNSQSQFCWGGICFSFETDTSGTEMTLTPGETTMEFSGHYNPNSTVGISMVSYTFYDTHNPANYATVVVQYNSIFSLSCAGDDTIAPSTRKLNGDVNLTMHDIIKVHNHAPVPLSLIAFKTMVPVPVDSSTNWMFFGGTEYPFGVDTTGVHTIAGTTTDESFEMFYAPDGHAGQTQIVYTFLDPTQQSGYALFWIIFDASTTGISDETLRNVTFSAPYPNPSDSYVNFDFDIPNEVNRADILITNLLGAVVYEGTIGSHSGSKRIDVSNLESGIYFATLRLDNQIASTQKVLVK